MVIIVGRIKWARSLSSHLKELLDSVCAHHVLKNLPLTAELAKRHHNADAMLRTYESDMIAIWMNQKVNITKICSLL